MPVLYQEDLIGEETKEQATMLALTPSQQAAKVVDAIQAKVKNEPSQFSCLIKVLRLNPAVCHLADLLERVETQQSGSGMYTDSQYDVSRLNIMYIGKSHSKRH